MTGEAGVNTEDSGYRVLQRFKREGGREGGREGRTAWTTAVQLFHNNFRQALVAPHPSLVSLV